MRPQSPNSMNRSPSESKEHADNFKRTLDVAAKRFAALAKVEKRDAYNYRNVLAAAVK
jgi:hypothetical protein